MIIFVLLVVWAALHPTQSSGDCPLSSVMELSNSSYFYPVDIYAPKHVLNTLTLRNEIFPCYGALLKEVKHAHNCSAAARFCPVTQYNVVDATKRKFGSSSLCYLQKRLKNASESIRLITFGGSVTVGSNSQGCNAFDEPDRKYVHKRCSWFYHFGEWLRNISTANVTHYNLAHGGHTSYASALTITNSMKLNRLREFTSNDIIFLDHAANDDQESRSSLISREVESLIHRIYSLSVKNFWPAIVILDGNPMANHGKGFNVYPAVYESMARHYNIPMWSYRDAVLSSNAALHQDQFESFLNFSFNDWSESAHDIHPPWHVHLFMADLYSAIFQYEMQKCSNSDIIRTETLHSSPLLLPPPLSVSKLIMECSTKDPDFLSLSYDEIKQGLAVGTFKAEPANGWRLMEDGRRGKRSGQFLACLSVVRLGRGGFIVERGSNLNAPAGSLTVVLTTSTKELIARFKDVMVQIMYLRTYFNAGQVLVRMCGAGVTVLDALWEDHETNRVSVPEWKEERLELKHCVARNYTYPQIDFVHRYDRRDKTYRTARGYHKVKLLSVKVCGEAARPMRY